jgi:hypothetical protein
MHARTTARLGRLLLPFIVIASLFRVAEAQALRCEIRGTVSDQSGLAISWVVVTAKNRASGHAYATVASKAGEYWFRDLPAGSYLVTALSPGFRVLQVPAAAIQADSTGVLPLKLSRAAVATTVEVNASAEDPRYTRTTQTSGRARPAESPSDNFSPSVLTDTRRFIYSIWN